MIRSVVIAVVLAGFVGCSQQPAKIVPQQQKPKEQLHPLWLAHHAAVEEYKVRKEQLDAAESTNDSSTQDGAAKIQKAKNSLADAESVMTSTEKAWKDAGSPMTVKDH